MDFNAYFDYKDGELFWKVSTNTKIKVGQKAGGVGRYATVKVQNKLFALHRVIFAMHHGYIPKEVDHIDCNKLNNRIENLREVSRTQNQQNRKIQKNNTSGSKNVYWHKRSNTWQVQLRFNGKVKWIGNYENLELADLVAKEARSKYHCS